MGGVVSFTDGRRRQELRPRVMHFVLPLGIYGWYNILY